METYILHHDYTGFYVEASSYPERVGAAFYSLKKKRPNPDVRTFFGISCKDEFQKTIYKAAVREMYDGEAKKYKRNTFIVEKGIYRVETINDWKGKESRIGKAFTRLLKDPDLDDSAPCVEWYTGDDVMCMVRLKNPM